jgi:hypothetical protein
MLIIGGDQVLVLSTYTVTVFSSTTARFKAISPILPRLTSSSYAFKMGDNGVRPPSLTGGV